MLEVQECSFSRTITPELGLTSRSNVAVSFGRELHDPSPLAVLSIIHSGHSTGNMPRVKSFCFLLLVFFPLTRIEISIANVMFEQVTSPPCQNFLHVLKSRVGVGAMLHFCV